MLLGAGVAIDDRADYSSPCPDVELHQVTALHAAAAVRPTSQRFFRAIKLLVAAGACIHSVSAAGTPIDIAKQLELTELVKWSADLEIERSDVVELCEHPISNSSKSLGKISIN